MKRFTITTVAIATCLFGLSGCESTDKADTPATQASLGIINANCPAMPDSTVDPSVETVEYRGYEIGFCCPKCQPKWDAMTDADKAAFVEKALAAQE